MLSNIQTVLMPLTFGLLLLSMLLCWGQTAFFPSSNDKKLYNFVFYTSLLSLITLLVVRWIESGHFPLSNLYESLLFLSLSFLSFQLILQSKYLNPYREVEDKISFENGQSDQQRSIDMLQAIVSPLALVSYAFAFFDLPKEMQQATSLVPALQSNWLMMHVTVMVLSYAALLCGSLLSMAFLFIDFFSQQDLEKANRKLPPIAIAAVPSMLNWNKDGSGNGFLASSFNRWLLSQNNSPTQITQTNKAVTHTSNILQKTETKNFKSSSFVNSKIGAKELTFVQTEIPLSTNLSLCEKLDNYSYRMLGLGFPLLTVGILSGAVWANSAWGSYWSWDPKETWALITWLVFAIYLHARISKGLSGKRPAQIATVGFFVVWFCYLGVNMLGSGLHTYGSFYTK